MSDSAPGEYSPEKSDNLIHQTPKYSFGVKTQPPKPMDTPGKEFFFLFLILFLTLKIKFHQKKKI